MIRRVCRLEYVYDHDKTEGCIVRKEEANRSKKREEHMEQVLVSVVGEELRL